mgnify:CR=1 FL=1
MQRSQNSNTSSGSGGTSSNSNNGSNTGPSTAEDSSSGGKANPKIQDVAPDAPGMLMSLFDINFFIF